MILAAITATLSFAFFSGKRIQENLDAWLDLGTRLRKLLRKLREKFGSTRVDGDAASLLALVAAAEMEQSTSWTFVASLDVPLRTFVHRPPEALTHHPNTIYVRALQSESGKLVVVLVKSSGECTVVESYDCLNFG